MSFRPFSNVLFEVNNGRIDNPSCECKRHMNLHDGIHPTSENGGSPAGGAAGAEPDVSEFARRLRMTAQHLAKFLEEQYERLDSAARQCERVLEDRAALDSAKAELKQQMDEWEAGRRQREDEIRQEQDRLIAAWKNLESEQRKILATGGVPQNQHAIAPSPAVAAPMTQPAHPQPAAVQPPPQAAPMHNTPFRPDPSMPILETESGDFPAPVAPAVPVLPAAASSNQVFVEPTIPRPVASSPMSREAALDQFQRLKREIRTHSQRSRPNYND